MKKIITLFIFICCISIAYGQKPVVFSNKPSEFIDQVSKYLKGSTNEEIRATGEEFAGFWESSLNATQQQNLANLGAFMNKKGYTYSHYNDFFITIIRGTAVPGFNLDEFLDVADKMFKNETKMPIQNFISVSKAFLADSNLVKTNFNSVQPINGSFKFEYLTVVEEKSDLEKKLEKAQELQDAKVDEAFKDLSSDEADDWEVADEGNWEDEWEEEKVVQKAEKDVDMNKLSAVGYQEPEQPKVSGGVITFTDVDLYFTSIYDTAVVEKTSGSYMFTSKLFVANGGKMDWRSAGLEQGSCFVELGKWNYDMKGTGFRAENVNLTYPEKVNGKVEGIFEFKTQKVTDKSKATYPRFMSYHSVSEFANLGDNISLTGGFSLEGRKINTESVDGEIGKLIVKYDGKERFRAKGKRFDILDSTLYSSNVGVIVFMGLDSIIHPSMSLDYGLENHRLQLRKDRNTALTPFQDTYHKVEIRAEKLDWTLDNSIISMSIMSAPNQIPIEVKSYNYYNDDEYVRLSGIGSFHPLQSLVYYANEQNTDVVYVAEVAKAFKKPESTYAGAMSSLAQKGFVTFDRRSGKITVKEKAFFYVKARRKKTDYDNINISSLAGSQNAIINLEDNSLTLTGVKRFYLSDSLDVYNEPRDGKVVIRKNRNMSLHGKLIAGKYFFICDSMEFNYDRYEIQLNKIDSIQFSFKIEQKEEDKGKKPEEEKELGLAVDYASGMLYIDKPNNKATIIKNPGYPLFDAVTGAQVHFSDERILGGVYSEDVYFHIPPFDIDSLNSVNPNKANFPGKFYSGGIFPEFDETLVVRQDKNLSFGFIHKVPEEGYKIYQKEGSIFKGTIDMSDFGMRGDGYIEHITSKLYSNDFIYYPDSITTEKGSKIEMTKGNHKKTTFPNMTAENYKMKWDIREDSLHLWNNDSTKPFNFYKGNAFMNGEITIREDGLYGHGTVTTNHAEATSQMFNFQDDYFTGKYTEFHVNSEVVGKPTLRTTDAKLRFDMLKLEAIFGPEEEGFASTEFPFMEYKTSLGEGHLKINEDIVEMEMEKGGNIEDSYFYSTHPEQDSLVFNATHAICDLKKYKLDIFGVPFITVSDSKVIPAKGEVVIFEHAEMQKLHNASIIVDTIEEYHKLHSAEVQILSRSKVFEGEAKYSFVNIVNDTFNLNFDDFKSIPYSARKKDSRVYTSSIATIEEEDNFSISPRIQYKGNAYLSARKEFLGFDGFVKLDLNSSDISDYFVFKSDQVDPKSVQIDLSNPTDANGTPLVTGIFVSESENQVYTSFVSLKEGATDLPIIQVSGALSYNPEANEFTISDTAKLKEKTRVGNAVVFNDATTQLKYEGSFDFIKNTKDFQMFSGGSGFGNVKDKKYEFNTCTMLQYKIPGALLIAMSDTIFNRTRDEYAAIPEIDTLEFPLAELSDNKTIDLMLAQIQSTGEMLPLYEYSPKFNKTFVFTNMNLKWNIEENSFWCEDTIGLSNMGKKNMNVQTHGKLEIHKNSEGGEVNLLIQPNNETWYYLSYKDNILYMLSSDYEFNKAVFKRTKPLTERKEKEFLIQISNYVEKEEFIQKYVTKFYNKERKEPNFDSLEVVYTKLIESFSTDKTIIKATEEVNTDDGFEELDSEEIIEKTPDTKEPEKVDEVEEPADEFNDESTQEDLEKEFENSSITNTKDTKVKKTKTKEVEPEKVESEDTFEEEETKEEPKETAPKKVKEKKEKEVPKETPEKDEFEEL